MPREKSSILEHPIETKEKKMPKKQTLAEMKLTLKDCKAAVRMTKHEVTDSMKEFVAEPGTATAKNYRSAVSDHITAVVAENKAAVKVAAASE